MPKCVERDPSQLYLLPPDSRDWVPEDDLAHFALEAVERVPMGSFRVNERGTGSAQYHPRMMLALLIYCYANGIFGSRRIERADYEGKVAAREQREGRRKGKWPKPPQEEPRDEEQISLTDSDSALMRKNKRSEYRQCCNAQAVVDAEGSQLVLGSRVSRCASDRGELVADVDSMPDVLGSPDRVLADNGCATGTEFAELENRGREVLVAVGTEDRRRRHDFRPEKPGKPVKEPKADWLKRMQEKMSSDENRAHYRLRRQTVELVFGIVKEAMGFRQFLLRGLEKVEAEWALVTLAYNCKRLNNMRLA